MCTAKRRARRRILNGRKAEQPEARPSVDHTAIAKELIEFRLEFHTD